MLYVLIGLIIVACLLLWIVILVQNPKGGGLSSQMGGSSVTNIIGAKQSADVVEKATWIIISIVFVLVIFSSYVTSPGTDEVNPGLEGGAVQQQEQLTPGPEAGENTTTIPLDGGAETPEASPEDSEADN